ncbi:MAG TPA: hypothetical protein VKF38_03900 [Anaerolineaceae bacterium]|nr:hypothetical protein [Anaerolineaceae bacterium]
MISIRQVESLAGLVQWVVVGLNRTPVKSCRVAQVNQAANYRLSLERRPACSNTTVPAREPAYLRRLRCHCPSFLPYRTMAFWPVHAGRIPTACPFLRVVTGELRIAAAGAVVAAWVMTG